LNYKNKKPPSPYHTNPIEIFNCYWIGMVSINLGSKENVYTVIKNLKLVKLVPSLGAFTTPVSDARTSRGSMHKEEMDKSELADELLRISIRLEDVEDIIEDFLVALNCI
jgi:cystathionine beta-lyase/cystathionine gamma-synthase